MSFAFSAQSTGAEIAQALSKYIRDKTVLITGGSLGGIGVECAAEIAKHAPKSIILTARSQEKLDEAFAHIRSRVANAPLQPLILDLSSLKDIRRATHELDESIGSIDVLLHNAGVASLTTRTEEGLPVVYATNVYGPFLFTKLLLPKLLQSKNTARVVFVGGGQPRPQSSFRFDDPYCQHVPESEEFEFYTESKIGCWLLASGLARKAGNKVTSVVTSPGWVNTQLSRHLPRETKIAMGFHDENGVPNPNFRSLQQGAAPYIVSAFHPDDAYINGAYITSACVTAGEDKTPEAGRGQDKEERLWAVCERVVGRMAARRLWYIFVRACRMVGDILIGPLSRRMDRMPELIRACLKQLKLPSFIAIRVPGEYRMLRLMFACRGHWEK